MSTEGRGSVSSAASRLGRHQAGRWAGAAAAAVAAALGEASREPAPHLPPERNLLDVLTHSTKWSHRTSRRSGGGALLSQNSRGVFCGGRSVLLLCRGSEAIPPPDSRESRGHHWPRGLPSDPGRLGQACRERRARVESGGTLSGAAPSSPVLPSGWASRGQEVGGPDCGQGRGALPVTSHPPAPVV